MANATVEFSVFTKPWKTLPLAELGKLVAGLGFAGIELPVRPGFQVEPENAARDLPRAVRQLGEAGVKVFSVAGPTDLATIEACVEAGVPMIRTMAKVGPEGYRASEAQLQRELDALIPDLERHGIQLGVQNHNGDFVANASGLRKLLEKYEPKHVCAVWDCAHNALNGEGPELALDIIWPHLGMVNFKNAFWRRLNGPEAERAEWEPYWTTGRQGLASWPRVAAELRRRAYSGVVCLTAEYTYEPAVNRLVAEDIAYARNLFGEESLG